MRYIITIIITFILTESTSAQNHINRTLKTELDSMFVLDQKYRELLNTAMNDEKADSLARAYNVSKEDLPNHLWILQEQVDSSNTRRIRKIIEEYGYPGKSLVGTPTNEVAFYIIQHSTVIDKYLLSIRDAAEKKELPFTLYAMMQDRSLMYQGKEQIYGTQAKGLEVINPQTGQKERKMVIWPIKDAATVNERRKRAGFNQTVEQNAKRLGVKYEILTLSEVKKMQGKKSSPNQK